MRRVRKLKAAKGSPPISDCAVSNRQTGDRST